MSDKNRANEGKLLDPKQPFFGRSVAFNGPYHIVKSSSPPCQDLRDVQAACGDVQYRLERRLWDYYDTDVFCSSGNADEEVLRFEPRLGLAQTVDDDYANELGTANVSPLLARSHYWTVVSAVESDFVTAALCTGQSIDLPRDALAEIKFFGRLQGSKTHVLARMTFSNSASGRLARALAEKLEQDWSVDSQVLAGDAFATPGREVGTFTLPCGGFNCRPFDRSHTASKWVLHRAKIIETSYCNVGPIEIWGENQIHFKVTPFLNGQPCGIRVNSSVRIRVEYTVKE